MVNIKSKLKQLLSSELKKESFKSKMPVTKNRRVKSIALTVILLLGILFFIKVAPHAVSGESMKPTLQNNDHLFVSKHEAPKRYSLITFQPREKKNESYVKRVIGMPGDRIWLDQNTVYLNAQMAKKNPTPSNESELSGLDLPDGTLKIRVTWEVAAKLEGLSEIPNNQFFVLGDNRRHSTDSRELGLVDKNKIEGVVKFRYYPFNRLGLIE
ncbi:signal peptidase I [Enterococcus sp. DIV0724b]|uniref:signal peptidase I n=1 Tax=Enterococcus sp. DIV0724b TaxID=2774694 RepID=UPI003D2FDD4F